MQIICIVLLHTIARISSRISTPFAFSLASPERSGAGRTAKVTKPETINYRPSSRNAMACFARAFSVRSRLGMFVR